LCASVVRMQRARWGGGSEVKKRVGLTTFGGNVLSARDMRALFTRQNKKSISLSSPRAFAMRRKSANPQRAVKAKTIVVVSNGREMREEEEEKLVCCARKYLTKKREKII
jgi:hypothetical protein